MEVSSPSAGKAGPQSAPRPVRWRSLVEIFEDAHGLTRRWGASPSLNGATSLLPQGAYTTLRTYDHDKVVRLDQHAKRLVESASAALDPARARRALAGALKATRYPESRVRLTFAPPRLFVLVEPFEARADGLEGVSCVTLRLRRDNPRLKDTRFLATAEEVRRGLPSGIYEGLMLGDDGAILEGLSSNFFAVKEGVLRTEETRALRGVTRALVLEAAAGEMPVALRALGVDEVGEVSDCFITSASRGIVSVVRIDGQPIGGGTPGELTRRLMDRFEALIKREARSVF